MKSLVRISALASLLVLVIAGYNNFSFPGRDSETFHAISRSLMKPEKRYVKIEGKLFEHNPSGVYNVNGVPTLYKTYPKPKEPEKKAKPRLGPPIDPSIYNEAIGITDSEQ